MNAAAATNASLYDVARRVIRAGIVEARTRRLKVRPGSLGVEHGEASSMWVEDCFEEGFTPVGLVLLEKITDTESPFMAAAEILSVGEGWLLGVDDGWNGERMVRATPLYFDGCDFGAELRREFVKG